MKIQRGKHVSADTLQWAYNCLVGARDAVDLLVDRYGHEEVEQAMYHSNSGTLNDNLAYLMTELLEMVDIDLSKPVQQEVIGHTAQRAIEEGDCRSYLDEHGGVFTTKAQLEVVKGALEQLVPSVQVSFNNAIDWGVEDNSNTQGETHAHHR